jgi:hypothetical protein
MTSRRPGRVKTSCHKLDVAAIHLGSESLDRSVPVYLCFRRSSERPVLGVDTRCAMLWGLNISVRLRRNDTSHSMVTCGREWGLSRHKTRFAETLMSKGERFVVEFAHLKPRHCAHEAEYHAFERNPSPIDCFDSIHRATTDLGYIRNRGHGLLATGAVQFSTYENLMRAYQAEMRTMLSYANTELGRSLLSLSTSWAKHQRA